jgi:hypothetical protein
MSRLITASLFAVVLAGVGVWTAAPVVAAPQKTCTTSCYGGMAPTCTTHCYGGVCTTSCTPGIPPTCTTTCY